MNPKPERLSANPDLVGLTSLELLDQAVQVKDIEKEDLFMLYTAWKPHQALTDAKLIVLLNNHISTAQWCCPSDEGLWYTDEYPEEMWIQGFTTSWVQAPWKSSKGLELLTARYLDNPWVAGMDLRNEIRPEHDLGATYTFDDFWWF